jgi:hypothetical protein
MEPLTNLIRKRKDIKQLKAQGTIKEDEMGPELFHDKFDHFAFFAFFL